MLNTTSKSMRNDPLFLRNTFNGTGKWGIPLVRKQLIDLDVPCLIACSDTKLHDNEEHRRFGVHFFVDDYRFCRIYDHPEKSLNRYSQYAFLLTPDFSTYADMNPWRQLESVAKNRWVGAYWQSKGLTVIPTVSWSTPSSYEYCFDGVEKGSIVSVGMIGCKRNKRLFLDGYNHMLRYIKPEAILCFGTPFPEMKGKIITVDYMKSRKVAR